MKKEANGKILRHKTRLVAKGYVQEHGVDVEDIFAHVTQMDTVRQLLAFTVKNA